MAEPETERNQEIVDAVREMFAEAAMRLPAEIEPALIYSLSPPPGDADRGMESV